MQSDRESKEKKGKAEEEKSIQFLRGLLKELSVVTDQKAQAIKNSKEQHKIDAKILKMLDENLRWRNQLFAGITSQCKNSQISDPEDHPTKTPP